MFARSTTLALLLSCAALCAGRKVDPTFLHRYVPSVAAAPSDLSTPGCRYKPVFGAGDSDSAALRGIARFGELTVEPGGASGVTSYPREEQIYVVLDGEAVVGYGGRKVPVRKNDFLYLPPAVRHDISNPSARPCRVIVMGFRIPEDIDLAPPPAGPQIANIDDVKKQTVGGHPDSTLYQLLLGDTRSTRDRIAAAQVVTSLFVMEIAPGGTNFPHHHEREEEIYLLLDGEGDMVADGGMNGVEGRHPAKPGDAYFFRLNCTVGFYNRSGPGVPNAHILAVRSLFPFGGGRKAR